MSTVDEVFDSWEEMEESGALDKKLNSLQLNSSECLDDAQLTTLTSVKTTTTTRMIILGDDGMRSQYVAPKPTVKILKRPQRDSQGSGDGPLSLNGEKPKQPIKSLKQREQEYAEARKRILGEERSPEEQQLSQDNNKLQPNKQPQQQQEQYSNTCYNNSIGCNILRMPIGPDGTRGFNARR